MVSEKEWKDFTERFISRVLKEGSTVIHADGNWYDPTRRQLITEPTYIVIYFHKKSAQLSRQIDSLRYWYKTLLRQQSVLRVDKKCRTSF